MVASERPKSFVDGLIRRIAYRRHAASPPPKRLSSTAFVALAPIPRPACSDPYLDFRDGQSRGGRHARRSDQKRSARRMKRLLLRRNGGAHRFRRDRYVAQRAPTAVKMAFPIAWPTTAVSGSPRPTGPGKRSKATSIRRGRRDALSPRSPPRVGGDEMRCLRSVANLEAADRLLQCPVGVRDPFVLTKVVQPGIG